MTEHVEGTVAICSAGHELFKRAYRSDKNGFSYIASFPDDDEYVLFVTGSAHSCISKFAGCADSSISVTVAKISNQAGISSPSPSRGSSPPSRSISPDCRLFDSVGMTPVDGLVWREDEKKTPGEVKARSRSDDLARSRSSPRLGFENATLEALIVPSCKSGGAMNIELKDGLFTLPAPCVLADQPESFS